MHFRKRIFFFSRGPVIFIFVISYISQRKCNFQYHRSALKITTVNFFTSNLLVSLILKAIKVKSDLPTSAFPSMLRESTFYLFGLSGMIFFFKKNIMGQILYKMIQFLYVTDAYNDFYCISIMNSNMFCFTPLCTPMKRVATDCGKICRLSSYIFYNNR